MSNSKYYLGETTHSFLQSFVSKTPKVFEELNQEIESLDAPCMQIEPIQGQFMQLLIHSLAVKRILEIGTFVGHSSLWMAEALPEDGELITCDINEQWTNIAKRYWEKAQVSHKITLRLGPALSTMEQLEEASFDLIFIDADKANYPLYYQAAIELVKPNGLILLDNAFFGGDVLDQSNTRKSVVKIRETLDIMKHDQRIELSVLPIGDGIAIARKK